MNTSKLLLVIAACFIVGCAGFAKREPIQPDDFLIQKFKSMFRTQGHTNRLDIVHATRMILEDRIEYDVMARESDQSGFAGGASMTIVVKDTNWVVVAVGSWQQ